VVLGRADAAAEGHTDGDGHLHGALRAVVQLGHLAHDLVEGRVDEAVELDLHHGAVPPVGHPDGGAHDAGLGERAVEDPVRPEVLLQPVGDAEDTAELADVLAHQDHPGVVVHGAAQARGDRAAEGHGGHQRDPSWGAWEKDAR
jgi:hypothetical protein